MNEVRQAIQERRGRYQKLLKRSDMRTLVRRELEAAIEELEWVERQLGPLPEAGPETTAQQSQLFHEHTRTASR
jgi:hypothetical protein